MNQWFFLTVELKAAIRKTTFFDNSCRSNYHGYLFQYTLSGCGAYKSNGKTIFLTPGTAFFAVIPEKAAIIFLKKLINHGIFSIFIFDGSAVFLF